MQVLEKYCRDSEKTEEKNKDKSPISSDTFALVEAINSLVRVLENK